MDVSLGLISFILVVSMTAVQSVITKGPENALKKIGDNVTLECVMSNNNCEQVDWQKVEGPQSPKLVFRNSAGMLNTESFPTDRYNVSRNGGCNLTITQLAINDSGRFICVQGEGSVEHTRSSILVVIYGTESSCLSNVTSDALATGDGYSLWCAISVPLKGVEPSDVALSLEKIHGENETKDTSQPQIVKTTLTGTATKENITQRVCRASFAPSTQPGFDNKPASLVVCNTKEFIVSYPVDNIAIHKEAMTVTCTADGYPIPTLSWTDMMSGHVVETGSTLEIKGIVGETYTCTATNTFKGKVTSKHIAIIVGEGQEPSGGCSSGYVAGIAIASVAVVGALTVVTVVVVKKKKSCCSDEKEKGSDNFEKSEESTKPPIASGCPACCAACIVCCGLCVCCLKKKKGKKQKGKKSALEEPLNDFTSNEPTNTITSGRTKPPRMGEAPNRPGSECNYAELRPEPNPHQMKSNPVNNSTVYASVSVA